MLPKTNALSRRWPLVLVPALLLSLLVACSQPSSANPTLPEQPAPPEEPTPEVWEPLFSGTDLSGWYTWFPSLARDNDPNGVFRLENGVLHVMDVPEDIENREEGYLASLETYGSYHLRFEYMWGEKRFGNEDAPRGGGLLYHVGGPDKIWPRSLEFQIQQGDTGDLWLIDRTTADTTVASLQGTPQYLAGGESYTTVPAPFTRLQKSKTADTATGWNAVELIVSEDEIVHKVNGVVNNRITNPQQPAGVLRAGRIVFQAQNSEIMFRNLEIMRLEAAAP